MRDCSTWVTQPMRACSRRRVAPWLLEPRGVALQPDRIERRGARGSINGWSLSDLLGRKTAEQRVR